MEDPKDNEEVTADNDYPQETENDTSKLFFLETAVGHAAGVLDGKADVFTSDDLS